jgi:hypothetical protein
VRIWRKWLARRGRCPVVTATCRGRASELCSRNTHYRQPRSSTSSRERSLRVKNRMRVIRSSGSVRGRDGNIPAYSARQHGLARVARPWVTPAFLGGLGSLKITASAALFERHPLERTVQWRLVANELSITLLVRRCFQSRPGSRRKPATSSRAGEGKPLSGFDVRAWWRRPSLADGNYRGLKETRSRELAAEPILRVLSSRDGARVLRE